MVDDFNFLQVHCNKKESNNLLLFLHFIILPNLKYFDFLRIQCNKTSGSVDPAPGFCL